MLASNLWLQEGSRILSSEPLAAVALCNVMKSSVEFM